MAASVSRKRGRPAPASKATRLPPIPGESQRLPGSRPGPRKRTLSPKTREVYRRDWANFVAWCASHRLQPLPCRAETLIRYLNEHAPHSPRSVIYRELIVVCRTHRAEDKPSPRAYPAVRAWLKTYRSNASLPDARATPITPEILKTTAKHLYSLATDKKLRDRHRVTAIRDRALLLIGRGANLRPLDIRTLTVSDIEVETRGLTVRLSRSAILGGDVVVTLRRSKTPALCPVDAWRAWLKAAPYTSETTAFRLITSGEVRDRVLAPIDVCIALKRAVHAAGGDPEPISEHSLSAAFADTK